MAVAFTLLKVTALVAFTAIVGARVIPRLLDRVAMTRSRELFTLTVLVIALGIAVGSARIFGVSMALGAFLAGMVVGRSDYSLRAASDALPMRDAFAVLFFVSVGILLDPASLLDSPWLLAGSIAIVLVANPIVAFVIMWMMREPFTDRRDGGGGPGADRRVLVHPRDARPRPWPADARGHQHARGHVDRSPSSSIPCCSARSIRSSNGSRGNRACATISIGRASSTVMRRRRKTRAARHAHRAVLIGFGPTGRTVARLLKESGIEPTVVELNIETVRAIRESGMRCGLRRCDAAGDARRSRHRVGAKPDSHVGGDGEQHAK